jgi:uncharacterized protein
MAATFEIYANGSLAEVLQRNTWMGQAGKWLFMLESGRFWNVLGFALLGFVLGRRRFFRDEGQSLRHLAAALLVTLLALIALHLAAAHWAALSEGLAGTLLGQYRNNLMTLAGIALFLLAWEVRWLRRPMTWLAPPGRMSLSVYVSQSLYGVPLFYGFGLGLYQGLGQVNALLLGLALWAVQLLIAAAWLRRYHYGPLEWAWRAATYTRLDVPWRRPDRRA